MEGDLPHLRFLKKSIKSKYDDDCIDRLNYHFTCSFLLIISMIIAAKEYVGQPIQCLMPAESKSSWESVIEDYCFSEGTYFFEGKRFPSISEREDLKVSYYKWIPVYLMIHIFGFLLPLLIKKFIVPQLMAKELIPLMKNKEKMEAKDFKKLQGNKLFTLVYLLYKFLNFFNVFSHLLWMGLALNTSYSFYWGFEVINDLYYSRDYKMSQQFPRVTYCDYFRRDDTSSKVMQLPFQCFLPVNAFTEIIIIGLWNWYFLLSILNALDFIYWIIVTFVPGFNERFIKDLLAPHDVNGKDEWVKRMIKESISMDAITALRIIAFNHDNFTASDYAVNMFKLSLNETNEKGRKRDAERKRKKI